MIFCKITRDHISDDLNDFKRFKGSLSLKALKALYQDLPGFREISLHFMDFHVSCLSQ